MQTIVLIEKKYKRRMSFYFYILFLSKEEWAFRQTHESIIALFNYE